jgi:anti-anti-sigma regulatory factor/nitrogen fixation/metabolism regulation signal transduction histidine kinase
MKLWHDLRLRTRILLGYGLMFALIVALGAFLAFRTAALNSQIQQLNAEVELEVATGSHLASAVAVTQHAVDRYLQQPQPGNLQTATESLQRLTNEVANARAVLVSPQQRQHLDQLVDQVAQYQNSLQALSTLLDSQVSIRGDLNSSIFDAGANMNKAFTQYLTDGKQQQLTLVGFARTQGHLQLAALWSAHLVSEQVEASGQDALDELNLADFTLKVSRNQIDGPMKSLIDDMLTNIARASTAITQYTNNLAQVRQQRDTLLNDQGGRLKAQVDTIAAVALEQLTGATTNLETQSRQVQQITGTALLLTLLIVAAFGGLVPRSITRPLMELVAATRRLNQGDYTVVVSTRDGSEIGQLAASFNQMTAALSQQRAEVLAQQAALAERNQELEQTLAELRAATAAREQLAVTMRALSVPIVPILEHVILIPLVGEIDAGRAQTLLERLLDGITQEAARIAILDITGVPVVDISLVDWLIKTTMAADLLGCRCILVGISPEVAQALVASGAELTALTTRANLRQAVEYTIKTVANGKAGPYAR